MKVSELIDTVDRYREDYVFSDLNCHVSFGCDCGCGGDHYTPARWKKMVDTAMKAKTDLQKLCTKLGIEWDLDETG